MHEENSFITLTYNKENLPVGSSLVKEHFQGFMKRLRERIEPLKIKFYHCGEYGEECYKCGKSRRECGCSKFEIAIGRPHYHALIFGYEFPDKEFWKKIKNNLVFRSNLLEETWGKGFCSIGAVTFQSAAYTARYIMKKQGGKTAKKHYERIDPDTGEVTSKIPEYTTMSLRPHGIGESWYRKYHKDVFPDDCVVIEGKRYKTPRYYDKLLLAAEGADALEHVKELRVANALKRAADNTPARLAVRKQVQLFKVRRLKREFEDESTDV